MAKLNAQINQALASPELKSRLLAEGATASPTTPEAFGSKISQEIKRWEPVVKAGSVKAD